MSEVVVLAGGFGTRLRTVVPDLPKPMAPVAGRPLLEILLTQLSQKGVHRVVLSLGHMADVIVRHFGARFAGMEVVHEVEAHPLGTGGALRAALLRCESDCVLVVNGDTFLDLELDDLWARWRQCRRPMIVGKEVSDTARFGRLVLDGDSIGGFAERGMAGPGIINLGHYLLPRELFAEHAELPAQFSFEADFLAKHVSAIGFELFLSRGLFIDIGVPEDYRRAQRELAHYA